MSASHTMFSLRSCQYRLWIGKLRTACGTQCSPVGCIILQTIGSNGHDREIIRKLRAGESHQAIADWLVRQNPNFGGLGAEATTHRELVDVVRVFESRCQGQDGLHRFSPDVTADIPWTNVSTSHRLLGHLFDLYFTLVHPIIRLSRYKCAYTLISRRHLTIHYPNAWTCNRVEKGCDEPIMAIRCLFGSFERNFFRIPHRPNAQYGEKGLQQFEGTIRGRTF